jgi:hypothetical protein
MEQSMSARPTYKFAALLLALGFVTSQGEAQQTVTSAGSQRVALPETPAGRAANEWLEAFNAADSARLGAWNRKYALDRSVEQQLAFRRSTGGFDVLSIEKSEPRFIEYVVKERNSATTGLAVLELKDGEPAVIRTTNVLAIPPGGSLADFKVDAATRQRVIDAAVAKLDSNYVFPEVSTKMAAALRARAKKGEYESVSNGIVFASLLTEHLQEVSRDKHLRVNFSPRRVPDRRPDAAPDPAQRERFRRAMASDNCGFVRAEHLPGNVGYLKFNFFGDPEVCGPTASAAMNFLANVDALIVDLRDNGGGSPDMVAYVSSYLFSKRTHLNNLWTRRTNETREYFTTEVPGKRLGEDKPVYVLTSKRTFSGAEEFSYNLKNLKRATIIGETTGGGAHPVSGHKIDDHFTIGVPFARAINPISKTNWEGTGVEPDVKVAAGDALTTAQKLIAEKRSAPPAVP